jgi:arylsulfatase A-like enzyme
MASRESAGGQADGLHTAGRPNTLRVGQALVLSIAIGLLASWGELAILGIRRFGLGSWFRLDSHALWVGPLAAVLLFGAIGLTLASVGKVIPALRSAGVVGFLIGSLGAWNVLLAVPWLSQPAGLILSVGVGVQVGRALAIRAPRLRSSLNRVAILLGVTTLACGLTLTGWSTWRERSLTSSLPTLPSDTPNVLLLVLDTVGALWLDTYGFKQATSPELTRLARSGAQFDHAIAPAPWTLTSHASFFTGRYPHELKADWFVPLDKAHPTLAEQLRSVGYATGGFVANYSFGAPEFGLARGFIRYECYPVRWQELIENLAVTRRVVASPKIRRLFGYPDILNRKRASTVNEEVLAWVDRNPTRPFFVFANYFDAHQPYLPPAPYDRRFGAITREVLPGTRFTERTSILDSGERSRLSSRMLLEQRNAYYSSVAYVDGEVGRLLAALEARGRLDKTLVIVLSDHGEHLGDQGRFLHGSDLHTPVLHVPLLLRYPPRIPPGIRIRQPVTLRDLPATIVRLTGLEDRISFPGRSLSFAWGDTSGVSRPQSRVLSSFPGPVGVTAWAGSVYEGSLHYIRHHDGLEELFDYLRDPFEARNLLDSAASWPAVAELRAVSDSAWPDRGRRRSAASMRVPLKPDALTIPARYVPQ